MIFADFGLNYVCPLRLPYLGAWTNIKTLKRLTYDPEWIVTRAWNDRLRWLTF